MKLKTYIFLIPALLLMSCSDDFLTKLPETVVSSDNFYITEDDYLQAIVGVYVPLRDLYGTGIGNDDFGAWVMGEMRSDNTGFIFNTNRGYAASEYYDQFIDDANGGPVANKYNNNYIIIARANQILSRIDEADISQEAKDNYKGQALFLRSFAYFDLIQYFGDVPLLLEPSSSYADVNSPRVPTTEIYDQIILDVIEAAQILPNRNNQTRGFVSNGAAYTLLGNIYLVLEEWALAEEALLNVQGHSLLNNYASIFEPANKNNEEMIFSVQYWDDQSAGVPSNFAYQFIPALVDLGAAVPGFPVGFTNGTGGWNTPTIELLNAYEDNDLRKDASIGYINAEGYDMAPYTKKFVHSSNIPANTNNNWPVYRYAEVLLMIAEAKNEQGKLDAIEYLNMVHAHPRTGLSPIQSSGQNELRDLIFNERQVELAFENKRWLDLIRTDRAMEVMSAQFENIRANPQAYYYPEGIDLPAGSYTITETDLLFPIPQREIRVNPEIDQEDQNPGY